MVSNEENMKFQELINQRYSVRAYKPDPIEEHKLQQILEAARLAPTAANRQPFKVIVIHTQERKEDLLSIYQREWFIQAPLVLCLVGVLAEAWIRRDGKAYLGIDAAIVMDHMILAATELDLGTCFIAAFDEENARKALALPEDVEPILFTPLGYPADQPKIKTRKPLDEIIRYEHW
jgi:nitroreductase